MRGSILVRVYLACDCLKQFQSTTVSMFKTICNHEKMLQSACSNTKTDVASNNVHVRAVRTFCTPTFQTQIHQVQYVQTCLD